MRVLVDANVIIDALLPSEERPHGDRLSAIHVLDAVADLTIVGVITPVVFASVVYVVKPRKSVHQRRMNDALEFLLNICEWAPITPDHYRTALSSSFADVEDAVHFFAAGRLDVVITRNVRDYKDHVHVPVLTATQFVAKHL